MLKAWNFTKNKLRHRCLDNDLQKMFRTNILNRTIYVLHRTDTFGNSFNGRLMPRQLTDLNFKWR